MLSNGLPQWIEQRFTSSDGECDVFGWFNIVAITAGFSHTVGLKNDGTPFPFTINDSTLRDVSRKIFEAIRLFYRFENAHVLEDFSLVTEKDLDFIAEQVPEIFAYVPYKEKAAIKSALLKADYLTKEFWRRK